MPVHTPAALPLAPAAAAAPMQPVWDEALLRRYDTNGPRYTSYPTALSFHDQFTPGDLTQALERSNASKRPLSLYVHVPSAARSASTARVIKSLPKTLPLPSPI